MSSPRDATDPLPMPATEDAPPDYPVGYGKPPVHGRFQKGQSGNPQGGRRRRRRKKALSELLEEALDARLTRAHRPVTRREAIVAGLVEKAASGDLAAIKLLVDLMRKTDLVGDPELADDDEDPREVLIREMDRIAAAEARKRESRSLG